MKKLPILGLACVLAFLAVTSFARADATVDWQTVLATVQSASAQSISGQERSTVIVRTAVFAAANGLPAKAKPVRPAEAVPPDVSIDAAVAQAAYATLAVLYPDQIASLDSQLARSLAGLHDSTETIAAGRTWGEHVARVILADHDTEVFLNAFTFPGNTASSVNALPEATFPGSYSFAILAGTAGNSGTVDGAGDAARFNLPSSLTVDRLGNVYVADTGNHTLRKITPDGVVTTLAGRAGTPGSTDGTGSDARFKYPAGVAADNSGNVFVADNDNHTIRKITPEGVVSTLAGLAGSAGSADGTGKDARFYFPRDVAIDNAGSLVVAEGFYPDARIRKITPGGEASTLSIRTLLSEPIAVTVDSAGNVFVIDLDELFGNFLVKLTPKDGDQYVASPVYPPAGQTTFTWFDEPTAMGADGAGNLLVALRGGQIIKILPSGEILRPNVRGADSYTTDLAVDHLGDLYLTDTSHHIILKGVFDFNGLAITKQPESQIVSIGATATFTVEVTGQPAPTYQWFLNVKPINGATSPTLTLNNVQEVETGAIITVVMTNSRGSLTSNFAILTVVAPVQPPPPPPTANGAVGGGGAPSGWFAGILALLFAARRWGARVTTSLFG